MEDSNRVSTSGSPKIPVGFFVTSRNQCSTAVGVLEEFLQWLYQGSMQIGFGALQGLGVSTSRGFAKV